MFYDKVLKTRLAPQSRGPSRVASEFVMTAFADFKRCAEDDFLTLFEMAKYGFVLYAQFLRDASGLSESQCKQRIISLMERHLRDPKARSQAETLGKILEATASHAPLYDDIDVFREWEQAGPQMVEVATAQSREMV
jgi:hypothetical protein